MRVRVVLVEPSLPENVGMVARAMRCFGWSDLVLVGGVDPMHPMAVAAGPGAEEVLQSARTVRDLAAALAGFVAIGTTARAYDRPDRQTTDLREVLTRAVWSGDVAWVFGPERSGLARTHLASCQLLARIPTGPSSSRDQTTGFGPSLNLAQAVAICLYETRLAARDSVASLAPETGLLSLAQQLVPDRGLAEALQDELVNRQLAHQNDAPSKAHSLLAMLARWTATPHELALLRALAFQLKRRSSKTPGFS